jgi:hypothetical protein
MCAIGVSLWAFVLTGSSQAESPISENANRRFNEGVRFLTSQDPDRYEKAYREFKAAYADSPSWKILGNLGIVAHQLERDGEAIDAFTDYLAQGGKELSRDERHQFSEDLKLVESGYCTLKLQTLPDGAWIVDERLPESGRPVVNRYGPTEGPVELRVRAGHHRVRAELSGYVTQTWELSEKAGAVTSHTFELERVEEPVVAAAPVEHHPMADRANAESDGSGLRIGSYVAVGLGVVGAGVGTWLWMDAGDRSEKADAAHTACAEDSGGTGTACVEESDLYPAAKRLDEDEKRTRRLSVISFGAAGALLATGVMLFLISDTSPAADESAQGERASLTPWIDPRGFGGVSGRF